MQVRVEIPRQDLIEAEKSATGWRLRAIGCAELLERLAALTAIDSNPESWNLPTGQSHVDLTITEFILKTRGEWNYPIVEEELCHCRGVATCVVDRAIVNGARTGIAVTRLTGASTGCGTCRPRVEQIIRYRMEPLKNAVKKAA